MSTTVTTNTLPSNVPKLDVSGKNWAIYHIHFTCAVQSKGIWSHLDGSTPHPNAAAVVVEGAVQANAAAADAVVDAAVLATWQKDEALALDLLTQCIPDSTVIHTVSQPSAAAMWAEIVCEYTEKGTYAQTELHTKFLESKCPDKGDVHAWLDSLHVQKEELAQVGVAIDEKDFRSTIISSLPIYLSGFASSQLAAACLYSPTQTIGLDILISLISKEHDRQCTSHARRNVFSSSKQCEVDEAMAVNSPPVRPKGGSPA
jgi:hypothetical protein